MRPGWQLMSGQTANHFCHWLTERLQDAAEVQKQFTARSNPCAAPASAGTAAQQTSAAVVWPQTQTQWQECCRKSMQTGCFLPIFWSYYNLCCYCSHGLAPNFSNVAPSYNFSKWLLLAFFTLSMYMFHLILPTSTWFYLDFFPNNYFLLLSISF